MKKLICFLLAACLLSGILSLAAVARAVESVWRDTLSLTSVEPTPTDATPTDATLMGATSTDATSIDASPTDAMSTDVTPADETPTDTTPTDATPTDATQEGIPGDVDGNGEIESADARLALRVSVKLENIAENSAAFYAADVDADGKITPDDARTILRVSVKLDQIFVLSGLRVIYTGYEKKLSHNIESAGNRLYDGYCYLTYINTTPHEIWVGFCRTCVNGFWTQMYYVADGRHSEDKLGLRLAPGEKYDLALELNYSYSDGEIVPEEVAFVEITLEIYDTESKESFLLDPIVLTTGAALGEDRAPSSPILYSETKNGCTVSVLRYGLHKNSPAINVFANNESEEDYWVFPIVHHTDGTEEYMYLDFFVPAGKKAVASAITVMPPEETVDAIYFRVYAANWLHLLKDELLFEIGPFVPDDTLVPAESE